MTDRAKLDAKLATLNAHVSAALANRKAWMDEHMKDYADYQIGETLYDLDTGARLGVVTGHYRYHAGRNPQFDDSMSIDYEYRVEGMMHDNTSRQPTLAYGNAEELKVRLEMKIAGLQERSWANIFERKT